MQRYFVEAKDMSSEQFILTGDDAHHIVKVMRMKIGNEIIIANGLGQSAIAEIIEVHSNAVALQVVTRLQDAAALPVHVTIAQGLPKGDKMELVIQKGTEVGATRFLPFESERMIVQYDAKKEAKRLERWRKIAKEAAEQAHRSYLPEVTSVQSFHSLMQVMTEYDLVLFCYEEEAKAKQNNGLAGALANWRKSDKYEQLKNNDQPSNILVVIGPEGGFTEVEAAKAIQSGAIAISLGNNILRTETAGLVALSCILYDAGVMGGVS